MIYTIVKKDHGGNIQSIISFDCVKSFSESWSATVTSQTVEYGFNISDNINIEPPTYTIDGVISSYSLLNKDAEIFWDGNRFSTLGGVDIHSHIKAREEIIKVFKSRSIVSIVESTSLLDNDITQTSVMYDKLQSSYYKVIDNCVINGLDISTPDSGSGAFFVNMKIQKVEVALVTYTQLTDKQMTKKLTPYIERSPQVGSLTGTSDGKNANGEPTDVGSSTPEGAENKQQDLVNKIERLQNKVEKNIKEREILLHKQAINYITENRKDSWVENDGKQITLYYQQ